MAMLITDERRGSIKKTATTEGEKHVNTGMSSSTWNDTGRVAHRERVQSIRDCSQSWKTGNERDAERGNQGIDMQHRGVREGR